MASFSAGDGAALFFSHTLPARTRLAAAVGSAVSQASRRLGRGGGSVVGGRAILAVDPHALSRLAKGRDIALVSGTNGKTTTTSLLRAALSTDGPVATNLLGANLPPGLAAALAAEPGAVTAALEVDEAWLGKVVGETAPKAVALLNLSRDQLDRNNEVRTLASSWRRTFGPGASPDRLADPRADPPTVVANADDPMVAWGAGLAQEVRWIGAGLPWTDDAAGCPACGGRVKFSEGGDWACGTCDFRRPQLDAWLELGDLVRADGSRTTLRVSLPGRANLANAAIAVTVAEVMGRDPAASAESVSHVNEVVGRYATVTAGTTRARLLLAKNPAGWLEVFDVLRPAPLPAVVAINARIADGRDPSWLWDVPFERLAGRLVVATGERSRDLAVRLRYAGVEHRREPDLLKAIAATESGDVDVVANYTSFQQLRALLT